MQGNIVAKKVRSANTGTHLDDASNIDITYDKLWLYTMVLNDMITINRNVEFTDDLEWVESDLPISSKLSLDQSVKDIVGYKFGWEVPKEVDIEALTKDEKLLVGSDVVEDDDINIDKLIEYT